MFKNEQCQDPVLISKLALKLKLPIFWAGDWTWWPAEASSNLNYSLSLWSEPKHWLVLSWTACSSVPGGAHATVTEIKCLCALCSSLLSQMNLKGDWWAKVEEDVKIVWKLANKSLWTDPRLVGVDDLGKIRLKTGQRKMRKVQQISQKKKTEVHQPPANSAVRQRTTGH